MGFLKKLVTGFVNYATEEAERKRQLEKENSSHNDTPKRPIPPPVDSPKLYDKNHRAIPPDLRVDVFD